MHIFYQGRVRISIQVFKLPNYFSTPLKIIILECVLVYLQVGTEWEQVVEKIVRSRYQPLLLIYTNLNANPVATETAPSTRVMAPGYSMNQEKSK